MISLQYCYITSILVSYNEIKDISYNVSKGPLCCGDFCFIICGVNILKWNNLVLIIQVWSHIIKYLNVKNIKVSNY